MQILLAFMVFVIISGAILLLGVLASRYQDRPGARLKEMTGSNQPVQIRIPENIAPEDKLPMITRILSGKQFTESLYSELTSAGLSLRPSEFVGLCLASLAFFESLSLLLPRTLLNYVLLGMIGLSIPWIGVKIFQQKRRHDFEGQIVDALLMMASSLRSGFSFFKAMQIVAQEMPIPISQEFERAIQEINVGRPMEDALKEIVKRTKSYEFDLIVMTVLIQLQVGGNLADLMETIAGTIRERFRILGELKALTAEGKISGVVLFVLPFGLGLIFAVMNPTYISVLIDEKIGHYLIGVAVSLQLLGGLAIRKMMDLDV